MAHALRMLSIGTATQDVFLQGDIFEPVSEKGEYFEHLPLGAKLGLDDITFTTGGNAGNAAVTFARQGLDSEFMGILGTDLAAHAIMQEFDHEGVGTRHVHQDDRYRTSYSAILLAPGGERTILNYHGTTLHSSGVDIQLQAIADADWVYVSSVGSFTLLEHIISTAARHDTKVAFNPSAHELENPVKIRSLLDDVAVLLANKEEMQQIVEGKTAYELAQHAAHAVPVAVVSDGPHGVAATDGVTLVKAGMYQDVKVVDRLGAGDAFGSGFVAALAQGKSLADAVVLASANSTSVVTKIGAKAGILYKGAKLHDMPMTITDISNK